MSYTPSSPPSAPADPPKLLDRVRDRIRRKGYSIRTEKSYAHWIRRFILFHDKRHADVATTMIYTHVLNKGGRGVTSPLDQL